jgi:hypothetical protein
MMETIVFLDIDGVLVHWKYTPDKSGIITPTIENTLEEFDPQCVENLNILLFSLPAPKIVISSDWRLWYSQHELEYMLKEAGVRFPVIGTTTKNSNYSRGIQIKMWLEANNHNDTDIIIIDDWIDGITELFPDSNIIHVKNGLEEYGLKFKHIERFLQT